MWLTCLLSAQLEGGPRTLGPRQNIQELPEAIKESIRAWRQEVGLVGSGCVTLGGQLLSLSC